MSKCLEELFHLNFFVSVVLEGLCVAYLVFIGGLVAARVDANNNEHVLEAAVMFGLAYAALMQCAKDVSGSHINPAISFASLLTRRVSILRGICYIIFQCAGGILGALILKEMTSAEDLSRLAVTRLKSNISLAKGLGYEIIMTFIYAWVYFASQSSKNVFKGFGGPLAVGLTVGMAHVGIIQYTGCSLNPARSLGPAVIQEEFEDHWVYWVAPLLAASFAGLLHDLIFRNAKPKSKMRPRSCSITCCKPSRDESTVDDRPMEPEYLYRDIIVKKQEDNV